MNLMNDVLADYLDDFVVVFFDDILIYSKTLKDHAIHLSLRCAPTATGVNGNGRFDRTGMAVAPVSVAAAVN